MHLWCVEPIQFKGGIVTLIPKKGDLTQATNYRGILLLATVAKRLHGLLRTSLMATPGPKRVEGQLGGFPKQMVHFGFHAISTWTGYSTAVLYLDLSNAFHHLVREFVLGVANQNDFATLILHFPGISPEKMFCSIVLTNLHSGTVDGRNRAPVNTMWCPASDVNVG